MRMTRDKYGRKESDRIRNKHGLIIISCVEPKSLRVSGRYVPCTLYSVEVGEVGMVG